jgi:chromosome segregation ATPase
MTTPTTTSSSLDQIKTKVDELGKRFKAASAKKSNLSGLYQAKREELAALKKEIEDAGLDPKKLKEKRDELQTEVLAIIEDFEKRLTQVEEAFTAFEKK